MTHRLDSEHPRPFFEAPEGHTPVRRRLLLISFFFPPAQASGSLRWQKLSHYAAERGWGLDVITLDPSYVPSPDAARLADLASGTRVYGVPETTLPIERIAYAGWSLFRRLRARMRRERAAAAGPDSRDPARARSARPGSLARSEVRWAIGSPRSYVRAYFAWLRHASTGRWASDVAALAERLIDPAVHEAIVSSGPPHMAHEAGRRLSRKTGLPFIMDMRDPWSLSERLVEDHASPLWFLLASRYERRAVADAALVVTNTEPFRLAMSTLYPEARGRVITVMNGYDEGPVPPSRHQRCFIIAYAGAIYLDRDPRILFRAVARLTRELQLTPADLAVELIGHVEQYDAAPVSEIAREEGVTGFVTIGPPRPHRAALEFLAQATMLVSLPQDNHLAIPAKVFEYLRFEAWVLVMATRRSATGLLLRESGADVVEPDDLDGMVAILRARFLDHRRGIRPMRLATADRFSRRAQAAKLLDAVAACTSPDPSPASHLPPSNRLSRGQRPRPRPASAHE